ncbi:MAG TPA: DUF2268 domain-containing putative Zn-dependent protease [Symbiobacteriaceae bacterium]|nr:DUF2268 domain-containing putative Zn-dependent protease [Symbiobacteriaceae bacterium]
MAVIPLYRPIMQVLNATPYGYPVWPRFETEVFYPHRAYFEGLSATYGADFFGAGGLPAAVERAAPALRESLRHAPQYGLEAGAQQWLERVDPLLPWSAPNFYLGTLFFTAPAATVGILGRPSITLGVERFHPSPPQTGAKYWYHPAEIAEMVPHEAAHVARMQALGLPPTPRRLSLLDMVMLEGTALTFTDLLLGRQTLATFLPADHLAWHRANDDAVRAAAAAEFDREGMEIFRKYFSAGAPVSGYYVGYSICCDWLRQHGPGQMRNLVALPSRTILQTLSPLRQAP